jgi:hypothetical protein
VTRVEGRGENLAVLRARFPSLATILFDLEDDPIPDLGGWRSGSSNSRKPHSLDRSAGTGEGYLLVDLRGPARDHLPERMKNAAPEMVPLHAARIEDLGPSDFVKIDCAACSHTALLKPAFLARLGLEPRRRVLDLKDRVRCRGCGIRGRAVVSIKWER